MSRKILAKNPLVDIILPATSCTVKNISAIKKFLLNNHLQPNIFLEKKLVLSRAASHRFPSFSAETRFQQLQMAIENPDSKIIWCALGGYGSRELLPFLSQLKKPKQQKTFIGFSDISSLSTFLIQQWGWQVICAPMPLQIALNKVSKKSQQEILDVILSKKKKLIYKVKSLLHKTPAYTRVTGVIVGGCISVLAGHFGTKNQVDWQEKILFLEDEGECGERLDRYFNQLTDIMLETKSYPKAILLGNFLEANEFGTPEANNINLAIKKLVDRITASKIKTPIFQETSGCLGHSKNMMPLILGAKAEINADGFLTQKI